MADNGSILTKDSIINGMAKILWKSCWADAYEEAGGNLSGMKIEEVMPPIPVEAIVDAARLVGHVEEANGVGLYALVYRAAKADEAEGRGDAGDLFADDDYLTRFGECLAWEGTGNGVSWFDDHAKFEIEIPYFEPLATRQAAQIAVHEEGLPATLPMV